MSDDWAYVAMIVVIIGMICYWEWLIKNGKGSRENISDTSSPTDFNID